jgi:large subunit ribosomal protein L18
MEETMMARGPRFCVPYRRRREGKTDYKARKALLLSGKPRLVSRTSTKNILIQIITAKPEGDFTDVSAHSKEIVKTYGWKAPTGNIPSAYLTGLLCGLKAKSKRIDEVIFDLGLNSPSKGSRSFAALKGVLDAGVNIPHGNEKLPEERRINGEHIAEYAKTLATDSEEYQKRFSKYLQRKLQPQKLPDYFTKIKESIIKSFKGGEEG